MVFNNPNSVDANKLQEQSDITDKNKANYQGTNGRVGTESKSKSDESEPVLQTGTGKQVIWPTQV